MVLPNNLIADDKTFTACGVNLILSRRLSGAGLLLLAMADCTSSGILSRGTSNVSCHLDMLADCLSLCEVHGVDGSEELDMDEMLDSEDEEQGNGLESEVRLVCVESSGKICRSSVTVDSGRHGNKIY